MVPLRDLNRTCAERPASQRFPAQILCRILGNSIKPCFLDRLCRPCEKHGLWVLYTSLTAIGMAVFCLLFWTLRLTRISKVLALLWKIVFTPILWFIQSILAAKRCYDSIIF